MADNPSAYSAYLSLYDHTGEPNSLMAHNSSGGLGAMTSREAFARVISSPQFLAWEHELKYGKEKGK